MINDKRRYTDNEISDDDYIYDDFEDGIEEIELKFDEETEEASETDNESLKPESEIVGIQEEKAALEDDEPLDGEPEPSDNKPYRKIIIAMFAVVVLLFAAVALVYNRMPNKKAVNLYDYYEIGENETKLIYDCKPVKGGIINKDGVYYISNEFLCNNISDRFYYDREGQQLLYTDANNIYSSPVGTSEWSTGESVSQYKNTISFVENDILYIELDFVADRYPIYYEIDANPDRISIMQGNTVLRCPEFDKKAIVHENDSIKSKVMDISPYDGNTKWGIMEEAGRWTKLCSVNGLVGYVKSEYITSIKEVEFTAKCEKTEYTNQVRDHKIELVWHGVYGEADNARIAELLKDAKGVNVISPTWYQIINENGEMSSFAEEEYVQYIHSLGMEIWPLVNDFTSTSGEGWDEKNLLSSYKSRTNLISNIMNEINKYGFDGFNIDMEKVPKDCKEHFTQFIRELSVSMRNAGKVLSVDNYVPREYNAQYNRKAQGECVDYVIVMGYDEHYAGCEEAGSVASIQFVADGIYATCDLVPEEKVLNALPFYTRMFMEATDGSSDELQSKAYGMESAEKTVEELGLNKVWDNEVQQYVAEGIVGGIKYSIWLEDEKSIEAKMKVVRESGIGGIAAWELSSAKSTIWDIIKMN